MDLTPIVFVNTVVDIQPTSRYAGGGPDTAMVTSTLLFVDVPGDDVLRALGDDVTTSPGGVLVTVRSRVEVPGKDERYRFAIEQPPAPTQLVKNGDFSLVVLLPRSGVYETGPVFEVELVDYTKEPVPRVFGTFDLPSVANRICIAWYARQDPEDIVTYVYRKLTGGH